MLTLAFATRALDPAELSAGERSAFAQLELAARRREWLLGRAALKRVLARLGASPDTSRIAFPNASCSLSHCGGLAVAAGARDARLRGLGIDLELGRAVDARAARLFLTREERAAGPWLRLWTAKEAIFKADPDNAGRVLADYRLVDPARRVGWAKLAGSGHAAFRYASFRLRNGFVSLAVALL